MSDDKNKCKNESTRSVKVRDDNGNSDYLDSNREEGQTAEIRENTEDLRIDLMIEDLFQRLFGENLIGETFVDREINGYINEFMRQMRYEREFQNK